MRFAMKNDQPQIIKVIGVGGGGSNAVNHMFKKGIEGVDFAICNTDNQALNLSPVPVKIQLGPGLTEGRGAGSRPQIGKQACLESIEDVKRFLEDGTKMIFAISKQEGKTKLDVTHLGLVPAFECFDGCSKGWTYYLQNSLLPLITTGKGNPDRIAKQ